MAKLLEKPEKLKVKTNIESIPISIAKNGKAERVTKVYERWRVADQWWGEEVVRDYFRVKMSGGLVCDIYRDIIANAWYLSRIHD